MTVQTYRKKPVEIQAVQYDGENSEEILEFIKTGNGECHVNAANDRIYIETLEGQMAAEIDDFVIRGIKGEFYPCKPDIFSGSYDLVEGNL